MFEVGRLVATYREIARLQAELMIDLVAVADATPVAEFAPMEIGAALGWTRQAATEHLALATDLVRRLPTVHKALSQGEIDLPKARLISDAVAPLADPSTVVAAVLPEAGALTTGQLRSRLSKVVVEADADGAAGRHRRRIRDRRVVLQPETDGCASIYALNLPAVEAVAAFDRLTAQAHSLKREGDPRSIDQLRADLLLGTHDGRGHVTITAELATLVGLAESPAQLAGYGPVIADIARQVAAQQRGGTWRFGIRDGDRVYTGVTRRRPSAEITREVRLRDRTCRAPGCRVPAHRADIDHTTAWEVGGLTLPGNLGVLCRHHHRAKHEGGWQLRQPKPGRFVWRSPLGKTYAVRPEPP